MPFNHTHMKYNTEREKLIIPEYGRHVQKMVEHATKIKDSEEGSHAFLSPVTKNFLNSSASLVPPGSLVDTTLNLLFIRSFLNKSICVLFPTPSPPSNEMKTPFLEFKDLLICNNISIK